MNYEAIIGLEVHAELKTKTKMFCLCPNNPEERHPNVNICPICLAHPGTLPVINREAVLAVIKLGLALGSNIAKHSYFDRKSYFYPDLPKGYQISQYEHPLVSGGSLVNVPVRRVHLEEDTGRLSHGSNSTSLVDFNRAGLPLMELVTEPAVRDAETAVAFAKELQLLLRYLGISDADMEKGQMRVEANISLRPSGAKEFGTKVEVKNLNSIKAARDAINFEIERQAELLDKGEKVIQETRGWDDVKKITKSQRVKESAHDYRYFPEPDLPPLDLSELDLDKLRLDVPELPWEKRTRFISEYGLNENQADMLTTDRFSAQYFEEAASELKSLISDKETTMFQSLFNYFMTDFKGLLGSQEIVLSEVKVSPEHFAHLVALIEEGKVFSRMAKDILAKMFETGLDPEDIMKKTGMEQISDTTSLEMVIKKVVEENPKAVGDYLGGKTNAAQFLVGQAMKKTKGQSNPETLKKLLDDYLKNL